MKKNILDMGFELTFDGEKDNHVKFSANADGGHTIEVWSNDGDYTGNYSQVDVDISQIQSQVLLKYLILHLDKKGEYFNLILKVVEDWQQFWMNQTLDPEDTKRYRERACGIDANMRHNLAEKIMEVLR